MTLNEKYSEPESPFESRHSVSGNAPAPYVNTLLSGRRPSGWFRDHNQRSDGSPGRIGSIVNISSPGWNSERSSVRNTLFCWSMKYRPASPGLSGRRMKLLARAVQTQPRRSVAAFREVVVRQITFSALLFDSVRGPDQPFGPVKPMARALHVG